MALARVNTARSVCVERAVSRPRGRNISDLTDRDAIGRFYDFWAETIAPVWRFDLEVDGEDADAAARAVGAFLGAEEVVR